MTFAFRLPGLVAAVPVLLISCFASAAPDASSPEDAAVLPAPHVIRAKQPPHPEFPPCAPVTEASVDLPRPGNPVQAFALPQLDFCAEWNPEFTANGHHCCGKLGGTTRRNRRLQCAVHRRFSNYCAEMTPEQARYTDAAKAGKLGDILELIQRQAWLRGDQSFCSVNNGFLAWGRRLIPSTLNRIIVRREDRCTDFGTDPMIGMLEWLGRQLAKEFPAPAFAGTKLVVGDISAPRGGCLSGRGGRRGHLSHTTGQDVDTAFLIAKEGKESPLGFHRQFDIQPNWWFLKKLFRNPYACVKVVFLDKRIIRKLAKAVGRDPEWLRLARFIRHMPGHKHHFHIRVGDAPGEPGCAQNPELELEDYNDEQDLIDSATTEASGTEQL
ncbi:MAG: penicillin-insensitive murein endopeptidase [Oligoflexia bacterium]|nr:penicillin-insensitive murein endopeptidase [Oligoflexia bacterium]